jgi:hypothetical protein
MTTTDVMVLNDGGTYTGLPGCKLMRVDADRLEVEEQEAIDNGAVLLAFAREGDDAFSALAKLVRAEYPQECSLAEIANTWGEGLTAAELEALAKLERLSRDPDAGSPAADGAPDSSPDSGRLPRQECPVCHADVAVRRGGELREHPDHRHPKYGAAGAVRKGEVPKCPGSGRTFANERDVARGEELARQHGW